MFSPGAAVERRAVDRAFEGDRDPIALLGLRALGLCRERTVLFGDALDGLVDLGVGYFDDGLFDRKALEVGELDRRHHLDRNGVVEIGFAGQDVLNRFLLVGMVTLGSVASRKPSSVKSCELVSRMVCSTVSAITERP